MIESLYFNFTLLFLPRVDSEGSHFIEAWCPELDLYMTGRDFSEAWRYIHEAVRDQTQEYVSHWGRDFLRDKLQDGWNLLSDLEMGQEQLSQLQVFPLTQTLTRVNLGFWKSKWTLR